VIVPYSPGGNTDIMARLAGQYIAAKLGQSFMIENRPGGGGSIGAIGVARAQQDRAADHPVGPDFIPSKSAWMCPRRNSLPQSLTALRFQPGRRPIAAADQALF
jgi:hypothetical protein